MPKPSSGGASPACQDLPITLGVEAELFLVPPAPETCWPTPIHEGFGDADTRVRVMTALRRCAGGSIWCWPSPGSTSTTQPHDAIGWKRFLNG